MYLACLEDLLRAFPPNIIYDVKSLDVKNSPYLSLVKIIASQLGRNCSFIVDPEVSTEVVLTFFLFPNLRFPKTDSSLLILSLNINELLTRITKKPFNCRLFYFSLLMKQAQSAWSSLATSTTSG